MVLLALWSLIVGGSSRSGRGIGLVIARFQVRCPGSIPGCCYVSLDKKRTLAPASQLLNRDDIIVIVWQGTAEKQPLADAVSLVK